MLVGCTALVDIRKGEGGWKAITLRLTYELRETSLERHGKLLPEAIRIVVLKSERPPLLGDRKEKTVLPSVIGSFRRRMRSRSREVTNSAAR